MEKQTEEMRELIHEEIKKAVDGGLITWAEFAQYLTERLTEQDYRKQEWISVEERLPKNDYGKHWKDRKRYLVFTEPSGIMFVATYGYKEHDWWVNGDHLVLEKRNDREVTHWMPLPVAPKGE